MMEEVSRLYRCPRGHDVFARQAPHECPSCNDPDEPFMTDGTTLKDGWSAYQCDPCSNQFYAKDGDEPRCGMCGGPPTAEDDPSDQPREVPT